MGTTLHVLPHQNIALRSGRKICSILRIRTDISDEELEAYVNGARGLEH